MIKNCKILPRLFICYLFFCNLSIGQISEPNRSKELEIEQSKYLSVNTKVSKINHNCSSGDLAFTLDSEIKNISEETIVLQKDHLLWYKSIVQTPMEFDISKDDGFVTRIVYSNSFSKFNPDDYRVGNYVFLEKGQSLNFNYEINTPLATPTHKLGLTLGEYFVTNYITTWRKPTEYGIKFKENWKNERKILWIEPLLVSFPIKIDKNLAYICVSSDSK